MESRIIKISSIGNNSEWIKIPFNYRAISTGAEYIDPLTNISLSRVDHITIDDDNHTYGLVHSLRSYVREPLSSGGYTRLPSGVIIKAVQLYRSDLYSKDYMDTDDSTIRLLTMMKHLDELRKIYCLRRAVSVSIQKNKDDIRLTYQLEGEFDEKRCDLCGETLKPHRMTVIAIDYKINDDTGIAQVAQCEYCSKSLMPYYDKILGIVREDHYLA